MSAMLAPLPIEIEPYETRGSWVGTSGNDQWIYRFPNGYGASVVKGSYTYGGPQGLYEIAILKYDGDESHLTYDTPITSDVLGWQTLEVLGWQTLEDVAAVLVKVAAL